MSPAVENLPNELKVIKVCFFQNDLVGQEIKQNLNKIRIFKKKKTTISNILCTCVFLVFTQQVCTWNAFKYT